ncbi:hypothetical protein GCM10009837_42210 [Streptomyces durmitorensis]
MGIVARESSDRLRSVVRRDGAKMLDHIGVPESDAGHASELLDCSLMLGGRQLNGVDEGPWSRAR